MSRIPLVFIGANTSPWYERLRCLTECSSCLQLHHAPNWIAATHSVPELAQQVIPLLAIDGQLRETPARPFEELPRVFLHEDPSRHVIDEPSVCLCDDDKTINIRLVEEWIKNRHRNAPSAGFAADAAFGDVKVAKRLIASTVHDLRAPLATILGYCNLVGRGPELEVKTHEGLSLGNIIERINHSANSMIELINRNLIAFELDQGELKVNAVPADVRAELLNDFKIYEVLARNKGLEFKVECVKSVPSQVVLDRFLLVQLVGNLIDNAIKFTTRGFIKITTFYDPDSENLCVDIQDTGRGIHPGNHASIFEMFAHETADLDHPLSQRSFGLGLNNAKRLARSLDGDVMLLRSTPKKGTTFRVVVKAALCGSDSCETPDKNLTLIDNPREIPTTATPAAVGESSPETKPCGY